MNRNLALVVVVAAGLVPLGVMSPSSAAKDSQGGIPPVSETVTGQRITGSGVPSTNAKAGEGSVPPSHRFGTTADEPPPATDVQRDGPLARAVSSPTFKGFTQVASGPGSGSPPDTTLAAGSNRVLTLTNRRAKLVTKTGAQLAFTNLNKFFGAVDAGGVPVAPYLYDPKVIFDRNSQTYFAVALQGTTAATSRLYLAVSRPVDPDSFRPAQWCRYYFDTGMSVGGVATWMDYPGLGAGANTLVVSGNHFTDATEVFKGSVIRAWSKTHYANNTAGCPAWQSPATWNGTGTGVLPFTMAPTQHYTNPSTSSLATSPVYMANSVWGTSNYQVWKVANLSSGSPLLYGPLAVSGNATISSPEYLLPGGANGIGIDSGDTRVLQVAGVGDQLHLVHTNRCQMGSGATETCIRYVKLNVSATVAGDVSASISGQSMNGDEGWYYAYPSIAVNNDGAAGFAFNAASVGGYRGSAWGTKASASNAVDTRVWLRRGQCLVDATYQAEWNLYRAGDYSGAATDPDTSSIWVSSERSKQITGVGCGWQTHITRLTGL